jgi:hypothetical protein
MFSKRGWGRHRAYVFGGGRVGMPMRAPSSTSRRARLWRRRPSAGRLAARQGQRPSGEYATPSTGLAASRKPASAAMIQNIRRQPISLFRRRSISQFPLAIRADWALDRRGPRRCRGAIGLAHLARSQDRSCRGQQLIWCESSDPALAAGGSLSPSHSLPGSAQDPERSTSASLKGGRSGFRPCWAPGVVMRA